MDKIVFFIFVAPLIINVCLGGFLLFAISRHSITPSSRALMVLFAGAFIWSFGYSMELLSLSFAVKLFWAKFQYLGIVIVPLAWLFFAYQYVGASGWFERSLRQRVLLSTIPFLALVLTWTNELHGLVWREIDLQAIGSFEILAIQHGPMFWLHLAFAYCLIFYGSIKMISGLIASFPINRWRNSLRLLAIVIPWVGNMIYVTGLNPIPHLDWSPLSFVVAGSLFSVSLYQFPLIDILPIAQKTVFGVLPDCLLVLDTQDRLVDLNVAAKKMIERKDASLTGKPISEVIPELSQWVSMAKPHEPFQVEVTRGTAPHQRFYDLRIVPLTSSYRRLVGRLIVCHEITQHKQAQAQLEQARAQLEGAVRERTLELRRTVEQLQIELAQRTLAEKRFEDVIEFAPDAMLLVDQDGQIILVNDQTERLFGYARDELLGQNYENLIPQHLRGGFLAYVEQLISNPTVRQTTFSMPLLALRKDGSSFPVEVSLGILNTVDGLWIACNARDISERVKAEEQQTRLLEEIKHSREQLRALAVRLSEAQEYEQRQIAAELHDRVGQNLTGLNLNLQVIQNLIPEDGFAPVRRRLEDSMLLVEETTRQVRSVMSDLNPPLLEEYGLGAALRFSCEQFMERTGIKTKLFGEEITPRLPQREEMALFRIIQEGLNNVAKHAQATQVEIHAESSHHFVMLRIEDDGQGFDLNHVSNNSGLGHWGLLNIQERAASIGGELRVCSTPGKGTCLKILLGRGKQDD